MSSDSEWENKAEADRSQISRERGHALWKLLQHPSVYGMFQAFVSKPGTREFVLEHVWKVKPGMTVVDVGCGPASLRNLFPEGITYYGFDPSADYIADAEAAFADDTFHVGTMDSFHKEFGLLLDGKVDLIVCSGVLHHIPSCGMIEMLELGGRLLKSDGGRFSAIEPTFLLKQDFLSRWVLKRDRGMSILHDYEWRALFEQFFPKVNIRVINGLLRIPYSHVLIEAEFQST